MILYLKITGQQSREGIMGAFYFPASAPVDSDDRYGVFVYPDLTSCVSGMWRENILVEGRYRTIVETCVSESGNVKIKVEQNKNSPNLTYSPPSYSSFGLPPTQGDPFEENTVDVKESTIEGAEEGLFATRDIEKGELVSFYSGFITHCKFMRDHSYKHITEEEDNFLRR